MHKYRRKQLITILLVVSLAFGMTGCGEVTVTTESADESSKETSKETAEETSDESSKKTMNEESERKRDDKIRAQDDYFGYINKDTLQSIDVNYMTTYRGAAQEIQEEVDQEIYEMIDSIVKSNEEYPKGSNEQIVKAAYEQILSYINGQQTSSKEQFLISAKEIQSISSIDGCKNEITELRDKGIFSILNVNINVDYFNGNRYALYMNQTSDIFGYDLKDIYEDDETRKDLCKYVMNVLVACGENPKQAKQKADDFVYAMIDIACATDFTIQDAANPFITYIYQTDQEIDRNIENLTIEEIEGIYKLDNPNDGWLIQDKEQLKAVSRMFNPEDVELIKTWLLCKNMYEYRDFLFKDYSFLEGDSEQIRKKPEVKAALVTSTIWSNQVSELYAKYYYTDAMNDSLQRMYQDISGSYEQLITNATWLTDTTRESLLNKLHSMVFVYGGGEPHEVLEKDAELIGKDAFESMVMIKQKEIAERVGLLGQIPDKSVSDMPAQAVNASYNPSNTFTIPVAIMHAPYFDVNADYATNLGGLGMVMAHEMGHAFDSNCIEFDEKGVYNPDRIPKEDRDRLMEHLEAMEDYYSAYQILSVYHVNGKQTSGENYADKGAMECLMNIIKGSEDQQKLFENYARIWCELAEDNSVIEQLQKDEHSPSEARVNAVLSSTEEFYKVYDVKETDGMYIEPEKRIRRW